MQTAVAPDYQTQLDRATVILNRLKQGFSNDLDIAYYNPGTDEQGRLPTYAAAIEHWEHVVEVLQTLIEQPPLIPQYEQEVEQAQARLHETEQIISLRLPEKSEAESAYEQAIEEGDIEIACRLHSKLAVYGDLLKHLEARHHERATLLHSHQFNLSEASRKLALVQPDYAQMDLSEMDYWE